ncbi:MAG: patatin-like phospholipase family protein [Myxococcota bacterium]
MFQAQRELRKLRKNMHYARSYEEWWDAAREADRVSGLEQWRYEQESPHYDAELLARQLRQMRKLRADEDVAGLHRVIEESLHRNLGDLSNPVLYTYAYTGTKRLIEDFLDEVRHVFDWLCDTPLPSYPDHLKLKLVKEALRVFGRTALILSGGGALGLYHLGVVKTLFERDLLPQIISGASMGAIVAGATCVRDDNALPELWESPERIHRQAVRLLDPLGVVRQGCLLDPELLHEHLEANLGTTTFREAYRRSGRILNIAVSPTRRSQNPRLLNWITSPDVLITSAAAASCALPALFPPGRLMRRDEHSGTVPYISAERWVDGSIHGDVPMMSLGRLHNVNHCIVSQANPHIVPFARLEDSNGLFPTLIDVATSGVRAQVRQTLNLGRRRIAAPLWRSPFEWAHAIAHQPHTGDITIHPPNLGLANLTRVMKNPTLAELKAFILMGERATWPKLALIRCQTRISRSMARCMVRLERRLAWNNAHPA